MGKIVECLNCGEKQELECLSKDNLGFYTNCNKCESSFDIDIETNVESIKNKIIEYIEWGGCGELDSLIELYYTDVQFVEALENEYELFDYDEWKHFQRLIGTSIKFDTFKQISSLLYEEKDINVNDLPYDNFDNNKKINRYGEWM